MATKSRFINNTPGPWKREPGQRFKLDHSAGVLGPDGLYIASALDFNRQDRDDEVEANARLIAAAPELLAAIERALPHLTVVACEDCNNGTSDVPPHDCPVDVATVARAAIAKAKGS